MQSTIMVGGKVYPAPFVVHRITTDAGPFIMQWPSQMSAEDLAIVERFIADISPKIKRSLVGSDEEKSLGKLVGQLCDGANS